MWVRRPVVMARAGKVQGMGSDKVWGRCVLPACVMLLSASMSESAWAAAPSPLGQWVRVDSAVKTDITKCGKDYCAVNIWVRNPAGAERVGDRLVMMLAPGTHADVLRGSAYDVRRRRHYLITLTLDGTHMTTKGCILFGIICKSARWNRID